MVATNKRTGEACRHNPVCYTQSLLFKLRMEQLEVLAQQRERDMLYGPPYAGLFSAKAV